MTQVTHPSAPHPSPQSPETTARQLAEQVDELLARDVTGAEEAAILEQAQELVNDALGSNH